ncbi:MAG: 30S ribosomal protein S5 [Euryarchaeota archaeon]|nr:30S ribosomal protein S5 [Euryarchaeota archaeon]
MRRQKWVPKTGLGRKVKNGEITDIEEILSKGLLIKESKIVDTLLPVLTSRDNQEILDINMVQRMTDSGRRVKFNVISAVGNKDGIVGLGQAKAGEVGTAIRSSMDDAKLHLTTVKRGCGSWECGCGAAHSIPFKVSGKSSTVKVTLFPAPRGLGLAIGDVGKKIMKLAGITDIWSQAFGRTQTTINLAKAIFNCIINLGNMSYQERHSRRLGIADGTAKSRSKKSEKEEGEPDE